MFNGHETLVTGATGFVGKVLCPALERRGYAVRRGVRYDSGHDAVRVGEIGPDTDWSAALAGVDYVVHLAARVHVMKDDADDPLVEFRRVNVAGTERLARQAAQQGVRRFVYLSSIKVNGEGCTHPHLQGAALSPNPSPLGGGECDVYRESDLPRPRDAYGVSKWEAEQVLKKISVETGMEVVILRPPLVYGPAVRGNFLRLLQLIASGIPLPFANVGNRRDLIYVGNLVDAIVTCIGHPQAAGQTFLVCDGEPLSTPGLITRLAQSMGKTPHLFPVPSFFLRVLGHVGGKAALQRLTGSLQIDSSHIQHTLNWHPPFPAHEGLHATAQWYLAEHG